MAASTTAHAGNSSGRSHGGVRKVEFGKDLSFQAELWRRADEYFRTTGRRQRDLWPMYLKSVIILAICASSYLLLVFVAQTLWQGLLLAVVLALSTAAIGFNIQHDGGHLSYSDRRWVNRLAACSLDLVGSSSHRWHWKHTIIHHMYVNITGYDHDIAITPLARFSPHQPRYWHHRWQHLYMWLFYGLLAVKLQLYNDFAYAITGRIGPHTVPRPRGRELAIFIGGKAVFFTWAFILPMMLHPVLTVLFYYAVAAVVLGMAMVLVFILPHLVDKADFPLAEAASDSNPADDGSKDDSRPPATKPVARPPSKGPAARLEAPFAVHQARVTVDFARNNRLLTWLLGGLNYHKEHHLFPTICHLNYPALSKVVEQTCSDFGLPYHTHRSFSAGLAAHYRWLKLMGRGNK